MRRLDVDGARLALERGRHGEGLRGAIRGLCEAALSRGDARRAATAMAGSLARAGEWTTRPTLELVADGDPRLAALIAKRLTAVCEGARGGARDRMGARTAAGEVLALLEGRRAAD